MTLDHEIKALDAMNIKAMDDMNESGSWARGSRCYELLDAMNDMKDSRA